MGRLYKGIQVFLYMRKTKLAIDAAVTIEKTIQDSECPMKRELFQDYRSNQFHLIESLKCNEYSAKVREVYNQMVKKEEENGSVCPFLLGLPKIYDF